MQVASRPKVLVVDDNEQNRILAEETLRAEDCDVALAQNGEEAIEIFARERPDLVLLDVRMPGLDGFATCARLRALPEGAATPIVFLTALRDLETFDRASRAGADDFLTKPIRPAELSARVATLLRIRRLNVELSDHFHIVRKQRDDLVRLQLQKEQLVSFVVHDLKNPVSSIELHASLIARGKGLPEDAREAANWILRDTNNMKRLVMNLLDIARGDDGKLEPRRAPLDLGALVESVVLGVGVRAAERDQTLETRVPSERLRISADIDLLRRVLENLLDNALRYSPRGGRIVLGLEREKAGSVILRVADNGPGIPEAQRERIFDRYIQVESPGGQSEMRAGRGLGLTFCRMAVEAHGGAIWIDPTARGTVFCVRLPDGP